MSFISDIFGGKSIGDIIGGAVVGALGGTTNPTTSGTPNTGVNGGIPFTVGISTQVKNLLIWGGVGIVSVTLLIVTLGRKRR